MSVCHTLFAGIGSPHGDDQIGWLVANTLFEQQLDGVNVHQFASPSDLLDTLADCNRLCICDACRTDSKHFDGGFIRPQKWTWPTPLVASVRSAGSHSFGLPQVLELADKLGTLPAEVVIYGIPAEQFNAFSPISTRLHENLTAIVKVIVNDLAVTPMTGTTTHA